MYNDSIDTLVSVDEMMVMEASSPYDVISKADLFLWNTALRAALPGLSDRINSMLTSINVFELTGCHVQHVTVDTVNGSLIAHGRLF